MKKYYITPLTETVNVELQKFIAASDTSVGVDEDYTETDPNNVASRRGGSLWD